MAITAIVIVALATGAAIAATDTPLDTVKHLVTQVLAIVKDKQMAQPDKQKKLRELAAANLDFDQMSRMAMGSSWRSLSAEQQRQFVPVFSSFLEDSYINKVQNYSDQEIQITNSRMTEPNFAHVSGRVAQQGAEPIQLGFALKRESGAWKIYDIALDNVSTLHGYRVEFHRVLAQNGFDALMKQIQQRDRELASTLGSPTGLPF
ncbi:MAG TPA: ABC transporter substrate-binding protein [Candidatus Binataceae bacterium]|nr:ABC transporter substrate-binding protein [Candidatus Binataceae bacterium]